MVVALHLILTSIAVTNGHILNETIPNEIGKRPCTTELDLHHDYCSIQDLPTQALLDICDKMGIDVEHDIFPELLQGPEKESHGDNTKLSRRKPMHDDYVTAAEHCIVAEYKQYLEEQSKIHDLRVLAQDEERLGEYLLLVLVDHPHLVHELEETLKEEDSELWDAVAEELKQGESLAHRPDILLRIIRQLLEEDPSILDFENNENMSANGEL